MKVLAPLTNPPWKSWRPPWRTWRRATGWSAWSPMSPGSPREFRSGSWSTGTAGHPAFPGRRYDLRANRHAGRRIPRRASATGDEFLCRRVGPDLRHEPRTGGGPWRIVRRGRPRHRGPTETLAAHLRRAYGGAALPRAVRRRGATH